MDFSHKYLVHYYEADPSRCLTLPALVQYFEDIAILHSSSLGYNLEYFEANRCGWMLLKWDITIRALPMFGDEVTVTTRVHAMKRFLADREFTMTASDGSLLANGRSNWLFADIDKRRPIRIDEKQYECFGVNRESEKDFVSIDDVPSVPASGTAGGEFLHSAVRAANTDIDTNRHVNNVSYIKWALDTLPPDFADRRTPVHIAVQYRKEIEIGGNAEVVSVIEPAALRGGADLSGDTLEVSGHTVRSGGEDCCSVRIGWGA